MNKNSLLLYLLLLLIFISNAVGLGWMIFQAQLVNKSISLLTTAVKDIQKDTEHIDDSLTWGEISVEVNGAVEVSNDYENALRVQVTNY